jgi:two-component system cell cycle sensor histidine kinase PleC
LSEVMASEMFGPLGSPRYVGYVGDILASGRHLLAVINDILDIAKIEAGQMEFDLDLVQPAEVVAAAIRIVESRADAGGLFLGSHVPDDIPPLLADRRRLLQILVNLLSNAVKFTPEGGSVEVSVAILGEYLDFTVSDTGIGMSDDEVVVAMLPFRQVDGSLARRYDGTGLGLPLVRAFVDLQGGHLDIVSRKGEGTRVTVRMPMRNAGEALLVAGE